MHSGVSACRRATLWALPRFPVLFICLIDSNKKRKIYIKNITLSVRAYLVTAVLSNRLPKKRPGDRCRIDFRFLETLA